MVLALSGLGLCPRHSGDRVFKVRGGISGPAGLAGVAVLIRRPASRAVPFNKAVGKKHALHRVVHLVNLSNVNEALGMQGLVNAFGKLSVLFGMRGVVVVKLHPKP